MAEQMSTASRRLVQRITWELVEQTGKSPLSGVSTEHWENGGAPGSSVELGRCPRSAAGALGAAMARVARDQGSAGPVRVLESQVGVASVWLCDEAVQAKRARPITKKNVNWRMVIPR